MASYAANSYPPGKANQALLIRATAPGGGIFANVTGRLGVGFLREPSNYSGVCPGQSGSVTRTTSTGFLLAGIDLDTRQPFVILDTPYTEIFYPPVSFSSLTFENLSVSVSFTSWSYSLLISDSKTGSAVFSISNQSYPYGFTVGGWIRPGFMYYGTQNTGDTVYIREFLSAR